MTKETFEMAFYCSVTDKPFTVQFERPDNFGLFTISDIRKLNFRFNNNKQSHQSMPSEVNADNISITGFKCPYCAHDGSNNIAVYLRCGTCQNYVCGGNTGKFFFHCRPSCGSSSLMVKTGSIETYVGSLGKATKQLVSTEGNIQSALPSKTHLKISQITKQISILITRED